MVAPSAAVGAAVSQMCISRAPPVEWCTGFKTEQKTEDDVGAVALEHGGWWEGHTENSWL